LTFQETVMDLTSEVWHFSVMSL